MEDMMSFKQMVLLYFITLAVFFVIDMIWLGVVAKGFYRRHLGSLMSPKVNWISAVLFSNCKYRLISLHRANHRYSDTA
jgi:uncharacterized membrane protein